MTWLACLMLMLVDMLTIGHRLPPVAMLSPSAWSLWLYAMHDCDEI